MTKQRVGPDICQHILFMHAVIGCDTTSRLHWIGNGASLNKSQASNSFRQQAEVLHTHSASKHDVTCAGEKALVVVYNGNSTDSLDSLRHQRFFEKVATTNIRSSNVPQSSCVPASPRMEGICWWKSSDRVGVVAM